MNRIRNILNSVWIDHVSIVHIFFLGFLLRFGAIFLDPFLHDWDEKFHALVARNMMDDPWKPMLRSEIFTASYEKYAWCCNHVWLHKQPLFLWQMALSMKIFGISEWSMRLPSAIMGSIMIYYLYQIAYYISDSKRIAKLASILLCFSFFHMILISGIKGMDHNDVAHSFYILASIWAWINFQKTDQKKWIILIGLFSGAAILNKWLTGLFVFLIWGSYIFQKYLKNEKIKAQTLYFLSSLAICFITFLPWQIYIFNRFPDIAAYEFYLNTRHIFEVIENHSGDWTYYFNYLNRLAGEGLFVLIPLGTIYILRKNTLHKTIHISLILGILFVFSFYSFLVKTKIEAYLFFIVPICFIYIAYILDYIFEKIQHKYILNIFILIIATLMLNPIYFIKYCSEDNTERNTRIYNTSIYKHLKKDIPTDIRLVINSASFEDIDLMFYNPGIHAYHHSLERSDIDFWKSKKIKIAILKSDKPQDIPEYILQYPYLYVLNKKVKSR